MRMGSVCGECMSEVGAFWSWLAQGCPTQEGNIAVRALRQGQTEQDGWGAGSKEEAVAYGEKVGVRFLALGAQTYVGKWLGT